MEDEYLTVEEVAKLLKTSEVTVRRWINAGKLRAGKMGRNWRIKRTDLDALFEQSIKKGK